MFNKIVIFALFVSTLSLVSAGLSCLDAHQNSVAWFSLIKYPGDLTTRVPRYAHINANSGSNFQVISGAFADSINQPLPNTINAINSKPSGQLSVLLFNDEPPTAQANSRGAHAKGIIAFDAASQTGIYILHSIPKFPSLNSDNTISYKIPTTAIKYGQSAYCISLNRETLGHVLINLPIMKPTIYYSTGIFKSLPTKGNDHYKIKQFPLLNGDDQWFLTKNPNYSGFLYEDIIIPYFKISLATESWGRPYQGPHCSSSHSVNIEKIAINRQDQWSHTNDHSKWTISTEHSSIKISCLCDMNRMASQSSRGGSCLCSKNPNLHKALSSIIAATDHC